MSGPDFSKMSMIPVIAQDFENGDVLMLAYMNQTAYEETLKTGKVCYYSRSRDKLWRKGEESGNVQEVKEIFFENGQVDNLVKRLAIDDETPHQGFFDKNIKK